MKLLITLAWRNLWRNRRRTLITITAVVFATWFSIAMRGIQLGTYDDNISYALNLFSGYVQLQQPDYRDNPSLQKSFRMDERIIRSLDNDARVKGYAPRVYADGLISFRDNSQGAAIFGISPQVERKVTRLSDKIREGRMVASDSAMEIVMGQTMLENLHAKIGDEIVVLAQGYDGALGNMKYRIVGSIRTGMQDFDRSGVFIGIVALQELVSMQNKVSVIAVSLNDLHDVDAFTEEMNAVLDTAQVRALGWEEVMPDLKQSIDLDNYSGMLFLGILLVVVAFGILNTVLMSVTERFKEFGILLSVGMPQGRLVTLVLIETIFITLLGILVGNLLGLAVNWYLAVNPIVFSGDYASMMEEYGWLPQMKSIVRASSFLNTSFSVLLISLLSALYPLYRVHALEPLKGIRYT
ncbi:MAG: ABC transporter permease [Bacteroidetes bacterium]|nr:ABC transporter permease [Bacteroidota bacterium]